MHGSRSEFLPNHKIVSIPALFRTGNFGYSAKWLTICNSIRVYLHIGLYTRISSKHNTMNLPINGLSTWLMTHINVLDGLDKQPNNITNHS